MLTRLAPLKVPFAKSGTLVPSGAIRVALSAESFVKAALSWTVSLATLNVPLKLGMVSVEVSRAGDGRGGGRRDASGRADPTRNTAVR